MDNRQNLRDEEKQCEEKGLKRRVTMPSFNPSHLNIVFPILFSVHLLRC